ncbi:MAG: hypothetical protein K2X11_14255 [Acetobacteraceae bacterium]|nr:hypothetical protein [Acetobacteraceae bacterium]
MQHPAADAAHVPGAGDGPLAGIARLAASALAADTAAIWRREPGGPRLAAAAGFVAGGLPPRSALPALAFEGELAVGDLTDDARFAADALTREPWRFRAVASAPIRDEDGAPLGALAILDRVAGRVERAPMLIELAELAGSVMRLADALRLAQEGAMADPETGLLTRVAFLAMLSQAIVRQERRPQSMALLHVAIAGDDESPQETAHSLHLCIRGGDVLARMAPREYAALLLDGDGTEATVVGARVCRVVAERAAARGCAVTAAVGALVIPGPVADAWEALDEAAGLSRAAPPGGLAEGIHGGG